MEDLNPQTPSNLMDAEFDICSQVIFNFWLTWEHWSVQTLATLNSSASSHLSLTGQVDADQGLFLHITKTLLP